MTLKEKIKQMSDRELAEMLIQVKTEIDYDYDMDDELYECGEIDFYVTTNNDSYYDYNDAIQHQIALLDMELDLLG